MCLYYGCSLFWFSVKYIQLVLNALTSILISLLAVEELLPHS
jgi:hypothetical protein